MMEKPRRERWQATTSVALAPGNVDSPQPLTPNWSDHLMSAFSLSVPMLPRTTCGAAPCAQIITLGVLALFVVVMVVLGQPLTVAAGVAGWLATVTAPAPPTRRNKRRNEV
jgi:hypothetical protein